MSNISVELLREQIGVARNIQKIIREYNQLTNGTANEDLYSILEDFCNLANEKIRKGGDDNDR